MIEYLIESVVCSALLYLGFLLLFRNSRNHHISRIILLFSVLFFLIAPLFKTSIKNSIAGHIINSETVSSTLSNLSITAEQAIPPLEDFSNNWLMWGFLFIYAIITLLLVTRLGFNLYQLTSGRLVAERVDYHGQKLALLERQVSPFSFFGTIYLSKESFKSGEIDHELIIHESGHVKQQHSFDILLIELVQSFCWFNPFTFLFKKLIKTNHEYLADEFVIRTGADRIAYSNKLINYTTKDKTSALASGFNYSLIKNRLVMLSKYDQKTPMIYRLTLFVLITASLFITTAFTNFSKADPGIASGNDTGVFFADRLLWSQEDNKVYLKGKVQVQFAENDFQGQGSFSFLGKVDLLVINGKKANFNTAFDVSGIKCTIKALSGKEAREKYGSEGQFGAIEVTAIK